MTGSGIQVRPIRISDLLRVRSMRTDALLPEQTHGPLGQRMPDPWSAMPVTRRQRRSFVAQFDGHLAGLIDLVTDPPNHRWVLSRMLTSRQLGTESRVGREAVWSELVLQAIRAAGAARAKRIHAVVEEESALVPVLVSTGFAEYAQDTVLMAHALPEIEAGSIVRQQDPSDVWAIHQLYHQITPRPVQYAEALTSNFWSRVVPGQPQSRGYVVENGFEIIAHCRVTQGCYGPVLHLMVQPDARELVSLVTRDVLTDLGSRRRPISIIVPDYVQEYMDPLRQLGFSPVGRITRLVKYTVVARRMQVKGLEELARGVPERVAAGTPTLSYAPSGENEQHTENVNNSHRKHGIS